MLKPLHKKVANNDTGENSHTGGQKEMSSIFADPIAPLDMSPNAGGGGVLRGLS